MKMLDVRINRLSIRTSGVTRDTVRESIADLEIEISRRLSGAAMRIVGGRDIASIAPDPIHVTSPLDPLQLRALLAQGVIDALPKGKRSDGQS